jgi:hypothetical protein
VKQFTSRIGVLVLLGVWNLFAQIPTASFGRARDIGAVLGISPSSPVKCGTSALVIAALQWDQLSADRRLGIQKILSRPPRQKDRLSPSGRFRIHYDTTGYDSPSLLTSGGSPIKVPNSVERYIDSVAAIFDSAWKLEVDTLGFLAPPADGTQGGGPEYDIYVSELGANLFGQTLWSDPADAITTGTRRTFMTYIEIDNDFLGMRTPGINGLKITAVHEFHHAIQVGSYGYWTNVPNYDFYFYELTSVWMEHVAYGSIRDYIFDLPNYLQRFRDSQNRSLSFSTYTNEYLGYERSIWAQYMSKRFGRDIMKKIWTGMIADPVLTSTDKVLQSLGSTIETEFSQFSYWTYFTADRAQPTKYYEEAKLWPRFSPNVALTFGGMSASVASAGWPLSTQFCQFAVPGDTVTAILANVDAKDAVDPSPTTTGYLLQLNSSNGPSPYQKVSGGLMLSFVPVEKAQWKTLYMQSSTKSVASDVADAFPNPFHVAQDSKLALPLGGSTEKRATVYFLNSAMELILSRDYEVTESFGTKVLYISVSDLRNNVPSGIYYVKASCGDKEFQWKVAVIQ